MTRHNGSLPPDYFDKLYASDPDPWRFATSDYERDKYATTLAALDGRHFASALEIGCSIGVLTAQLAAHCDALLAVDVADAALAQARQRCAAMPHVRFARMQMPQQWPDGEYDLILLSEVLYYLDAADIARLSARVNRSLAPGGLALLVHWTGETDYPVSGDRAVEIFTAASALRAEPVQRQAAYRLDRLHAATHRGSHLPHPSVPPIR